jgi:hypothetical protein
MDEAVIPVEQKIMTVIIQKRNLSKKYTYLLFKRPDISRFFLKRRV